MTNGYPYEMLLPCNCGDRPMIESQDCGYWVECSMEHWRHGPYDYPAVGDSDGFETAEQAVLAWNKLMVKGEQ